MVYLKCTLPQAKHEGGKLVYRLPGREWHFDPYEAISLSDYALTKKYFDALPDSFELVTQEEYEAHMTELAEKEAAIFYCGDFGGETNAEKFCGKRVDDIGMRCEHHGGKDEEKQGDYDVGELERPGNLR